MSDKDGGPAFPWPGDITPNRGGMTTRDYFAAQVMVGLGTWSPIEWRLGEPASYEHAAVLKARAVLAYAQADAMLEARKR